MLVCLVSENCAINFIGKKEKEKGKDGNFQLPIFFFLLIYFHKQRQYTRKAGLCKVTAKFELKPPPYPLVTYAFFCFLTFYVMLYSYMCFKIFAVMWVH